MKNININLNEIPQNAGIISVEFSGRKMLKISSIRELKKWVLNLIKDVDQDTKIVIEGYMSNCIALQIGKWMPEEGNIYYKNHSGFSWKMI